MPSDFAIGDVPFGGTTPSGGQTYTISITSAGVTASGSFVGGRAYSVSITSAGVTAAGSFAGGRIYRISITSAGVAASGSTNAFERKHDDETLWQFFPKQLRLADPRFQYRSPWWTPRDFS